MSSAQIAALGAIAGLTIFLGLPIGRLREPMPKLRALLSATATGILIFLLWDVLDHAWEPVDAALSDHRYASAFGNGIVLARCFGVGLAGLVYFDRWVARRSARSLGPGTASVAELEPKLTGLARLSDLPMMIAIGIGLHNFAEGLAIGNSAAQGELQLAVLLVIGFGLHNATEGFGIVAPMAAVGRRPLVGLPGRARARRRRPHVRGHPGRAERGERDHLHRLPGPGRRLDSLRRDRAAGGGPQAGPQGDHHLGHPARCAAGLRHGCRGHGRRGLTRQARSTACDSTGERPTRQ